MVLVVLKRHYQFWFVATALHKLGAVLVPATYMLTAHDVEYRINSASIKAVICTAQGETAAAFDAVLDVCPSLQTRILVGGKREGWHDFNEEMEKASDQLERVETHLHEPMLMYFSSGTAGISQNGAARPPPTRLATSLPPSTGTTSTPEGLHFTIADTGWGKAVWGKIYGQWIMESCVFAYDSDIRLCPRKILLP